MASLAAAAPIPLAAPVIITLFGGRWADGADRFRAGMPAG
jgi:hypothetical protein